MEKRGPAEKDRRALILNVDDSEAGRYAVSRIPRGEGFEILEAATGGQALERVRRGPDRVLLDVNLPDLNGLEVCRRIKAAPATAGIPMLHLSAPCQDGASKIKGMEDGADGYPTHPVEPRALSACARPLPRGRGGPAPQRGALPHSFRLRLPAGTLDGAGGKSPLRLPLLRTGDRLPPGNPSQEPRLPGEDDPAPGPARLGLPSGKDRPVRPGRPFKFRVIRRDGQVRWIKRVCQNVFGREGNFLGRVDPNIQITERKETEEEPRPPKEKCRTLVENAGGAIFIVQDPAVRFASPKTREMLGYTARELALIPVAEHIHPDDRRVFMESHEKALLRWSSCSPIMPLPGAAADAWRMGQGSSSTNHKDLEKLAEALAGLTKEGGFSA